MNGGHGMRQNMLSLKNFQCKSGKINSKYSKNASSFGAFFFILYPKLFRMKKNCEKNCEKFNSK